MDYNIMDLFAYPTIFLTVFFGFITLLTVLGTFYNVYKGFRYLYLITYKRSPKLIIDAEEKTSVYYEYDASLKKYVRNDNAIYDKNDPNIYKIEIFGHILSF
jgi:hypothetical protein